MEIVFATVSVLVLMCGVGVLVLHRPLAARIQVLLERVVPRRARYRLDHLAGGPHTGLVVPAWGVGAVVIGLLGILFAAM
ncbi:hypothetical protein [Isoptericola sediminis]|uniref:Uncharacterized protein n=1 Tax=Isoptericola sediminis TaxID=2733572 RepID=A0A849JTY3_9MICO|nr:hypothetical protein [Isoptericola sediminis]NNU26024.1 hypothetical protein [Isoptericola sediminis]